MGSHAELERKCKGINLIELVKFLRHVRKQRTFRTVLSPQAEALLATQILPVGWYSHATFLELIDFVDREILDRDEEKAYAMGIAGGRAALSGPHKVFIDPGNVARSVLSMRHVWRSCFSFGELGAQLEDERTVLFRLTGYDDMTPCHAFMTAGWGAAAALLAGAKGARAKVHEGPWKGASHVLYRVSFEL
jgi:hypothetical protein